MPTNDSPLQIAALRSLSLELGQGGGGGGSQATVTGTGFGSAPNVVLWRNFESETAGQLVSSAAPSGEIGALATADMKCVEFGGRKAAAGFDAGVKKTLIAVQASDFTRFRHYVSIAVPDGSSFPASTDQGARTLPTGSTLKAVWAMKNDRGDLSGNGEADICLPTYNSQAQFEASGNSVNPGYFFRWKDPADDFWAWNEYNGFGWLQEADLINPKTVAGPLELFMTSSKMGTNVRTRTTAGAFEGSDSSVTDANAAYDRIKYNAYALDAGGNAQVYYSDLYLAVESSPGANDFVQCLFVGDAATFAACTVLRPLVADSWSDTSVAFTSPFSLSYYHIVKPDGSIVSGAI